MTKVELVYDSDCPNVDLARERISAALGELSMPQNWEEWDRSDANAPQYVLRYGSPTVLVNGEDVVSTTDLDGCNSCRVYHSENGAFDRAPSVSTIREAISKS